MRALPRRLPVRRLSALRRAARRDQRGLALPSPMVGLSVIAVALAGVAYVATDDAEPEEAAQVAQPADTDQSTAPAAPAPQKTAPPVPAPKKKKETAQPQPVDRGDTYVVVFNNTNISGLAGSVAAQAAGAGWQVVGSDNWVGTIPAPTVYYPPGLEEAGAMLARDLGIQRTMPAVEPMQFDRLTVILTGAI